MEVHVHCIYTWYVDQTGEKDKVVGWEVKGSTAYARPSSCEQGWFIIVLTDCKEVEWSRLLQAAFSLSLLPLPLPASCVCGMREGKL